ncbi:hypothetical protein ALI22I_09390 [Saccharothrix sp. ALI-22-I]|nr:hypothetical protein ALI22I_09390 [Saccharothrix sp. ALI-22-I]
MRWTVGVGIGLWRGCLTRFRLSPTTTWEHGESGAATAETEAIEQLGDDLDELIEKAVPEGRVVIVGHSNSPKPSSASSTHPTRTSSTPCP